MIGRGFFRRLALLALLAQCVSAFCQSLRPDNSAEPRPLTVEDVLRLEEISETSLSPDGQWIAYVVKRPQTDTGFYGRWPLLHNDHADVWVAAVAGGKPRNITNGAADKSGFWAPRWSPDGERLAMFSTRGGNVRLWVWTKASGRLEVISDRGVDPRWANGPWDPFVWISEREIAVGELPPGEKPQQMIQLTRVAEVIAHEWAKAWKGEETTASVLESGVPISTTNRPQGQVVVIDVSSRAERKIASGASFGQFLLSPDRRYLAILKQVGVWHPDSSIQQVDIIDPAIYEVMVADVERSFATRQWAGVTMPLQGSLLWSPDSRELALIGYTPESVPSNMSVFRCPVADTACRLVTNQVGDLDVYRQGRFAKPPAMWVGNAGLIVFGTAKDKPSEAGGPVQRRWWTFNEQGRPRDFFAGLEGSPSQLLPVAGGRYFIGLVNGHVWRIGNDGHGIQDVTPGAEVKITSIVWPYQRSSGPSVEDLLILAVSRRATDDLYRLDLKSGELTELTKPFPRATLVAFNSKVATEVFFAGDHTGSYIWSKTAAARSFTPIAELNTFRRTIWHGDLRKIEYRSLDGQPLKGWVILPYGFQEGKRYPLVAWVYPTRVFSDKPPEGQSIQGNNVFDMQLLAVHGYVVLMPSMPLPPYGEPNEVYADLSKGVQPAIDKVIEMGIADPQRLGVFGWSFGGFATYGLITQTKRFRAAVAGAGLPDLASLYGTFSLQFRYEANPHQDPFRFWNVETMCCGAPPWKDLGRYLRNAPINHVEQVETPLMIIHGDLDYGVGIEQAEEFFTALYRQNKRARFVRYFGEDHAILSPANIRDMWQRIYAWFDEFLKEPDDAKGRQHPN